MFGWILFIIASIFYVASMTYSQRKRVRLQAYTLYILLNDEIRNDHKKGLQYFINTSKSTDSSLLYNEASFTIDKMANDLSDKVGLLLVVSKIMWDFKNK